MTADGTFRAKVTALDVFKGRVVVTAFLIRGDGSVSDQQADTGHFRWADFKVISRGVRKPATPSQAEPQKEKWEVTQIPTSWSDGDAFKSYLADGWEPIGVAPYGLVWTDMEPHIFLRKPKAG